MSERQKQAERKQKTYTVVDSEESLYRRGVNADEVLQENPELRPRRAEIRTRRRTGKRDFLGKRVIHPALFSVLLILIVLVVSVFVFMNAQGMSPANLIEWVQGRVHGTAVGDGYPVKVSGSQAKPDNFQLLDRDPVLLSDTALLMYNGSGAQVSGRQHGYANPALRTGASRALLYDVGGYGYRLESRAALDYEGKTERKIFTGALSPGGVYALATAGDGYASVVSVYSRDHKKIYTRFMQDSYVTALDIRSDGTLLAAGGLRSDNGEISSSVLLMGFTDQEPVAKFDFSDTIILAIRFLSGGEVVLIGDRAAYLIDAGYKNIVTYDYQKRTLQGYSVHDSDGFALALTGADGKSCSLAVFNREGQVLAEKETGYPCTALYYAAGQIYLLSEDALLRYSEMLEPAGEEPCPAICKSLLINGPDCYLLSSGNIWKLDVRQ